MIALVISLPLKLVFNNYMIHIVKINVQNGQSLSISLSFDSRLESVREDLRRLERTRENLRKLTYSQRERTTVDKSRLEVNRLKTLFLSLSLFMQSVHLSSGRPVTIIDH